MVHHTLIDLHAFAGIVGFTLGCFVITPHTSVRSWKFQMYYYAMLCLIVLMIAVVLYDWRHLTAIERVVFTGLTGLGIYTFWRAQSAKHALTQRTAGWQSSYINHVAFTLISLFDGFSIVAAIDLKAPVAIVGIVAVLGVIVGIKAASFVKNRSTH